MMHGNNPSSNRRTASPDATSLLKRSFVVSADRITAASVHQQLLADYPMRYLGAQQMVDDFYDDDDHRLLTAGFSCCVRETTDKSVVCLMPVDALASGRVDEPTVSETFDEPVLWCDMSWDQLPAGALAERFKAALGDARVPQCYRAKTYRRHYQVSLNGAVRYAMLDSIQACDYRSSQGQVAGANYLELSLLCDPAQSTAVDAFCAALSAQFHMVASRGNLYRRILHGTGYLPQRASEMAQRPLNKAKTPTRLLRGYILHKLALMEYWQGVALEDMDPEGIHQMRVNVRRMRSTLRLFSTVLPRADVAHWQGEFRWLGQRLGAVRELDVFAEWLQMQAEKTSEHDADNYQRYRRDIAVLRHHAVDSAIRNLHSDRYTRLVAGFKTWLERADLIHDVYGTRAKDTAKLVESLVRKKIKKTSKHAANLDTAVDAQALHDLRIQAKRLRYALDLMVDAGNAKYSDLIAVCKQLQTVLGDHQDACDSASRIRHYALSDKANSHGQGFVFFLGQCYAEQSALISKHREAFFALRKRVVKALNASL